MTEENNYVPALMKAAKEMCRGYLDYANLCQGAAEYIKDLRASLRREENARKTLAETERRQAAEIARLTDIIDRCAS